MKGLTHKHNTSPNVQNRRLVLNGFIDFMCPMFIAYVAAKAARRALANMWLVPDAEAGADHHNQKHLPELRPTTVDALPRWCLPYYERIVFVLGSCVVVMITAGLYMKIVAALITGAGP